MHAQGIHLHESSDDLPSVNLFDAKALDAKELADLQAHRVLFSSCLLVDDCHGCRDSNTLVERRLSSTQV
jgi:hypothetical protein